MDAVSVEVVKTWWYGFVRCTLELSPHGIATTISIVEHGVDQYAFTLSDSANNFIVFRCYRKSFRMIRFFFRLIFDI